MFVVWSDIHNDEAEWGGEDQIAKPLSMQGVYVMNAYVGWKVDGIFEWLVVGEIINNHNIW